MEEPPSPSPRPGFYIKSGPRRRLRQRRGRRSRRRRSCSEVGSSRRCSAGRARSLPSLTSLSRRSEGFPPGSCAAPSSRSSCWRWSSARRPGDQRPRCRWAEGQCWPRCTRAATTGRWVSVLAARVVRSRALRAQPARGVLSPHLSAFSRPGSGVWVRSQPATEAPTAVSPNSTPASHSWEAGGSGPFIASRSLRVCAHPVSPGHPVSARLFRQTQA